MNLVGNKKELEHLITIKLIIMSWQRGSKLKELAQEQDMIIGNSWSQRQLRLIMDIEASLQ